jgi:hypothetical protein
MSSACDEKATIGCRGFKSRRWAWLVVLGVSLLIASLLAAPRVDLGWIDPVTGSLKYQTRWFGVSTSTTVEQSAIEKWIIAHEGQCSNTWTLLFDTSRNVWGGVYSRGCGQAPEIYELQTGELNDLFVQTASNDEVSEFLNVMRGGSDDEKRQRVRAAAETAFHRFAKR